MEFLSTCPELEALLNYVAKRDAKLVNKATSGIGTKDDLLIAVLCSRTKTQLAEVDRFYREETNGFALKTVLASEAGGNYGKALNYICRSRAQFLNEKLQVAMSGLGCDKDIVNEIFCLNSFDDVKEMRKIYEQTTDLNLADTLRKWLSGEHLELILSLLLLGRAEGPGNEEEAAGVAEKLFSKMNRGATLLGGLKDNTIRKVCDLLRRQSVEQCCLIREAWDKAGYFNMSLDQTLLEKVGNFCGKACQLLVTPPVDASCAKLKAAFDQVIMDNDTLCRILAGHDKYEAMRIAERYHEKYDRNLSDDIVRRTGSDFQKVLLTWISAADPTGGLEGALKTEPPDSSDVKIQAAANMMTSIAEFDADLLHMSKEGVGTDERMVVQVLCSRTKKQLEAIDSAYRRKYHTNLKEYCEAEMGGNLAQFLAFTQMSEAEFDSYVLMDAFSGLGCDKAVVVEVLVTRNFDRIKAAREYFENRTDKNLLDRVRSEMTGPLQRLCIRMINGPRGGISDEAFDAGAVADKIYSAGAGKLGTNEDLIVEVFTGHTLAQMQQVMIAYDAKYNTSLVSAVESEFSGNLRIALSGLLGDYVDTYCRRLKASQSGTLGTVDGKVINRIIGGNDKQYVRIIADRYFQKYDVDLATSIADKLSGDYKNAVVSYIKRKDPAAGLEGTTALRLDEAAAAAEADHREREAQEAAAAAELLRAEMEMARLRDESAAIEAARQADAERAAREEEERAANAAAALAAAEAEAEEERRKQAEKEAELAALRERLEAAKRAEEEAAAQAEALRKQMESEREAAALRAQQEAEATAAALRAAEAEAAAAAAATASDTDDSSSSSSDSSSDDDDDDAGMDVEARKHRRERRERRHKLRADRVAKREAKGARKRAKKEAGKAMKGLKKLGKR